MPEPETITCENCDAEIGKSETKCPKCGVVFEDLADAIASVETANKVIEKRKKKAELPVAPPAKKENPLRALGKVLRKK